MQTFEITGGTPLLGTIEVGGAKNVALKLLVASLLTDDELIIHNVPKLRDVLFMLDVLKSLGVKESFVGNTVRIQGGANVATTVPLEVGARLRTSSMVLGPMLARFGEAKLPNPGGCRIGARPIDRHIEGLKKMGATISYHSDDGYFYGVAKKLTGADITFEKNTHTGTETLILAAVLASGKTILRNAASEVEVDDLIGFLNSMGARIQRTAENEITIDGVESLHGSEYTVMPDRNEEVTFAIAAVVTKGDLTIKNSQRNNLESFIQKFSQVGGGIEEIDDKTTRYYYKEPLKASDIMTQRYPGFMTDWQAPWALLMTQSEGVSTLHETVFESRFSYVSELKKMGAVIEFYTPKVADPEKFYNFNWDDKVEGYFQGIRITGPTALHNAVLSIDDLRAGATLVLAALSANGQSYVHGVEQVDRGYEKIEKRLSRVGAHIKRIEEE
ncbi:UDP-N-acetylglucosamine 1-carboxyvinyltransferase [Candidatus Gottesmanbacteria bacterium]|nr:UDP-N-acetylglucosamine 1-carboxyvinyltransferase [Candidatus Gottesmanbacteria bacterium]